MGKYSKKSLFLNNTSITLETIYNTFYVSGNKKWIRGDYAAKSGANINFIFQSINKNIAWGDYRDGMVLSNDNGNHYMFYGANSCGAYPNCLSIAAERDGVLYLIREEFSDMYSNHPELSCRALFILTLGDALSKQNLYPFEFNDIDSLSSDEREYLKIVMNSVNSFDQLFGLCNQYEEEAQKIKSMNTNHQL